ncbi:Uncharacterised protein [Streptococcus pneumoniae]|nr:Uncharacterised protein [Streptococcus pneumoniae]CKG24467.1 Uncharacterised protein [Streptococcus pneumoniae]
MHILLGRMEYRYKYLLPLSNDINPELPLIDNQRYVEEVQFSLHELNNFHEVLGVLLLLTYHFEAFYEEVSLDELQLKYPSFVQYQLTAEEQKDIHKKQRASLASYALFHL